MRATLMIAGDLNLVNVHEAATPFSLLKDDFAQADIRFGNLECCLYRAPLIHSVDNEGFYAEPEAGGEALRLAGFDAVGTANNVTYGEAAILASMARLDAMGIPHTGAGAHLDAARKPAVVSFNGLRVGFLQRSCVFWPTHHEARKDAAGIAVIWGHTAYQVPIHRTRKDVRPFNRPGVPPDIVTWADHEYLKSFTEDIAVLRGKTDFVVASVHWGLDRDVLQYMRDIAHASIDAGADMVVGHGPHYCLAIEIYRGKPIYYGLGSFCFHTGHRGAEHTDWIGMRVRAQVEPGRVTRTSFRFVRRDRDNRTYLCDTASEAAALEDITERSAIYGVGLRRDDEEIAVDLLAP